MLAASVLPALHAYEHFLLDSGKYQIQSELTENVAKTAVDCDLCDFNFSSADEPEVFSYELHLPRKDSVQNISIAETVHLFPQTLFSLRAPPVAIA